METIRSSSSALGDCNRDIELLYEAFGSAFSLEAIASAYSKASRDVDMAVAILYDLQGQTSPRAHQSKDVKSASVSSSEYASQCPHTADRNVASLSPGNIISCSSMFKDDYNMNQDMEEFLFKMLGDGFQLDKEKIHEVLGLCGWDLEKSMETLVDLSASSLRKSDDVVSRTADMVNSMKVGSCPCPEKSELPSNPRSVSHNGEESCKKNKDKYDLQREILGSLFTVPARVERPRQVIPRTRVASRSIAFGRPVVKPLGETKIQETFVAVKPLGVAKEDADDENSFQVLRQAVKEYWALMKEYYKAAAEAYEKGDQAKALRLMKEGQFYKMKAQEADEMSTKKLLETREDEMLIDMSTLEPKEAVKLLRVHLSNLAGIPTIRYLKLTVGNDEVGSKKGGPKRLVLKQLEKESIEWTEVDNGKTIVIQLDEVNPKTLSFAKR